MTDPMVPMGEGIIALGVSGVMPLWPKMAYTALEMIVLVIGLIWYYRRYFDHKEAAMVLATLPLWFAWRSLLSYFYLGGILMMGVIIYERARKTKEQAAEPERISIAVALD